MLLPDRHVYGAVRPPSAIPGLFDERTLLLVQEVTGKVTGLSVIVLDAGGNPVPDQGTPSSLCRRLRRDKIFSPVCRSSDRYAVEQALAARGPFIHFCACGLIRAVIPLFAGGACQGFFSIGQVRCDNAPGTTPNLEYLSGGEPGREARNRHFREMLDLTPTYDYGYFCYVTDTVATVVNAIAASTSAHESRTRELENDRAALEERVTRLERDLNVARSSLAHWKSRLNLDFLVNVLNSVASLAIIEDAPRTNEMCALFAEHLRHYLTAERNFVPLGDELEAASRYLAMQKIRFGDMLEYSINAAENVAPLRAPAQVLLPFVENALLNGLAGPEGPYTLSLAAAVEGDDVVIVLRDNATALPPGLSPDAAGPARGGAEAEAAANSLAVAKFRLETFFGRQHRVSATVTGEGTECAIRYFLPHVEGER